MITSFSLNISFEIFNIIHQFALILKIFLISGEPPAGRPVCYRRKARVIKALFKY